MLHIFWQSSSVILVQNVRFKKSNPDPELYTKVSMAKCCSFCLFICKEVVISLLSGDMTGRFLLSAPQMPHSSHAIYIRAGGSLAVRALGQ